MKKISLTQDKYAIVDDSDYVFLNKNKWCLNSRPGRKLSYAKRAITLENGKQKFISMHSLLIDTPKGMVVDHIDGDGLNNQRKNLRICSHTQNTRNASLSKRNKSGSKGIFWNKTNNKWKVSIGVDKKLLHIGYFINKEEAQKAYRNASLIYHKEFSRI
jgi:hypothetical protein